MNIVLISPKGPLYRHNGGIFRKSLRIAPLTLSTLASLVPADLGAKISLWDEGIENMPDELHADLIGMTVITGTAPRAYELAARFRAHQFPVVLGGPHVTLVPDEAQKHADAIVTGYAEETWPALLRDFSAGSLKPRYCMDPEFSFRRMEHIPFPRRDLIKHSGYATLNSFEATRGCIHKCEFCVVPTAWGRRPFQKPIQHVVDDIRQQGARKLVFYDLNLIADPAYAKELFRALIPLRVKWFGLATTLIGQDPEMMDLIAKSGCRGLLIGFESVTPGVLQSLNKGFNHPQRYSELVRDLHALGIAINGTFVFGNDDDTKESFQAVEEFVMSSKIDLPRFAVLTPFPATPLYQRLDHAGRILTRDWSVYDGQHVVFQPAHMTPQELMDRHETIWRNVYSYRSIWHRIARRMPNMALIMGANLGYRFYAHRLRQFYNCLGGVA